MTRQTLPSSRLVPLCLALALAPLTGQPVAAKIVAEAELASFCKGEASAKLGVRPTELMTLPVEKTHGIFHVYGQTDSEPAKLFECTFDGKRNFQKVSVKGDHEHGGHAAGGAPKAAINKCLQMVGVPAKVEKVSPLQTGFSEIIIQEKNSPRKVACTVPDDGSEIENWVELN